MISTVADRLLTILRRHNVALRLETLLFWRAVILLDANFARPELAFDLNASLQRFFGGQEHDLGREIGADLLRPRTLEAISDLRLRSPAHAGRLLERPREIHARRASVPSGGEPVRWIAGAVLALGACAVAGAVVAR